MMAETAHDVPKGASVVLRGQVATMTSAYQQLFVGLAFAFVLIYLLIVVNFQSWLDPLVIVVALPTALAGIVWMLFASDTTLSVPALTGAIMCMGVATANSILVIALPGNVWRKAWTRWPRHGSGRHPFPAGADDGAGDGHRHDADGHRTRSEYAAWPRRDRRAAVRHQRDAVPRAGDVQPGARPRRDAAAASRRRSLD